MKKEFYKSGKYIPSGKRRAKSTSDLINETVGVPVHDRRKSSVLYDEPKFIIEPRPVCRYCEEKIESISEAIAVGDDSYAHYNCVVDKISSEQKVPEGSYITYLGSGDFGIVRPINQDEVVIEKRIPIESDIRNEKLKEYIRSLKI